MFHVGWELGTWTTQNIEHVSGVKDGILVICACVSIDASDAGLFSTSRGT